MFVVHKTERISFNFNGHTALDAAPATAFVVIYFYLFLPELIINDVI